MDVVILSAVNGARIRQIQVTSTATNLFAAAVGPPVVPYVANNRGVIAVNIYNKSANDWYLGYDNTVTDLLGVNPGITIPAGGSIFRQVGGVVANNGVWLISSAAGPDSGTIEEFL
jgi:hypothetical protein